MTLIANYFNDAASGASGILALMDRSLFGRVVYYLERRFNPFDRESDIVWGLLLEHLWLVFLSVFIATILSVTIGILISYYNWAASPVLAACQVLMTIPSLALLGFLVPLFGIGFNTGLIALVAYSFLPIVRNTYTGIRELSPAIVESARAMGMTEWRVLTKVKIPLAMPVIMAGIRTATVMVVGIGAIASKVGAGGLGDLIFQGISRTHEPMIIVGGIGVAIIALVFDFALSKRAVSNFFVLLVSGLSDLVSAITSPVRKLFAKKDQGYAASGTMGGKD